MDGCELNKAYREKHWSELGLEEKVERMREQVKRTQAHLSRLDRAVSRLAKHQHGINGELMHPIEHDYGSGDAPDRFPNKEVYF